MSHVSAELVQLAYEALASGDRPSIEKFWDDEMVWLVPGDHQLAGWKYGLGGFLEFMGRVGELTGGSFHMKTITIMVNDDFSCDVTNNQGTRAGDPSKKLNIDVAHVLRWRDGKVVAGKGGIFGNGTAMYDWFWS